MSLNSDAQPEMERGEGLFDRARAALRRLAEGGRSVEEFADAVDAAGPARTRDADNWLDTLQVASPCSADWDAMEGDDYVRHCRHCNLNVYNLSALPRNRAAAVVRDAEDRLCVRFHRRRDGTLLTKDCPVGFREMRRRLLCALGGVVSGGLGLLGLGLTVNQGAVARRIPVVGIVQEVPAPRPPLVSPPPRPVVGKIPVTMGRSAPFVRPEPIRRRVRRRRKRRKAPGS